MTGKATLIGPTGIPPLPFIPLTVNPGGSLNVYDESLFSIGGKLYTNFAAATLSPDGTPTILIQPAIYEINPKTGQARWIAPTDLGLGAIVDVNNKLCVQRCDRAGRHSGRDDRSDHPGN